jgi:hypothetical protein
MPLAGDRSKIRLIVDNSREPGLEHPPNLSASDHLVEGRQSVMGTAAGPPAK